MLHFEPIVCLPMAPTCLGTSENQVVNVTALIMLSSSGERGMPGLGLVSA